MTQAQVEIAARAVDCQEATGFGTEEVIQEVETTVQSLYIVELKNFRDQVTQVNDRLQVKLQAVGAHCKIRNTVQVKLTYLRANTNTPIFTHLELVNTGRSGYLLEKQGYTPLRLIEREQPVLSPQEIYNPDSRCEEKWKRLSSRR